jgi:hypothetical protein
VCTWRARGSAQAAAQSTITGAGLALGAVTTASSTTVASGNVISQNPVGGATVAPGSPVALVVSSGAPAPPAGGLVLALGFEEASGNPVVDSSAAPMNGVISERRASPPARSAAASPSTASTTG